MTTKTTNWNIETFDRNVSTNGKRKTEDLHGKIMVLWQKGTSTITIVDNYKYTYKNELLINIKSIITNTEDIIRLIGTIEPIAYVGCQQFNKTNTLKKGYNLVTLYRDNLVIYN